MRGVVGGWLLCPVEWQKMHLLPLHADVTEDLRAAGGGKARLGARAGTAGEAGGLRGAREWPSCSAAANTAGKHTEPCLGYFGIHPGRAALLRQILASCSLLAFPCQG